MRDVAERVGLSRQLVSIVLRGAPGASDASRERILAAAREIGYHPDDSARMLRRRRSGQIGVLFTMRQPFELDLVDALYTRAGEQGFTLALSAMSPSRSQQVALDELMRQRIEALIALDAEAGAETLAGLPVSIPTILLGGPRTAEPRDIVGVENKAGIELAVQHLVELGHRRIAYVGPERGPNAAERIAGYRDAMRALELPEQVEPSDYTEAGGYRAATELLRRAGRTAADATIDDLLSPGIAPAPPGTTASTTPPTSPQTTLPTALICVNDHCAIGALQTLVRAGVSVPAQVSVIGFDDSTAAALPYIDLTSVRPDPDRMAELAVDAVRARLADPSAEATVRRVTPTLVVRGSTAVPRP